MKIILEENEIGILYIESDWLNEKISRFIKTDFVGTLLQWLKAEKLRDGCKACGWDKYLVKLKEAGIDI